MTGNGISRSAPNWQVAVIDGHPERVVNVAGVAQLVKASPMGVENAMRMLKVSLAPDVFALVRAEVEA